jgi:ABC-type polysaccharide/polyol phosphate export permease
VRILRALAAPPYRNGIEDEKRMRAQWALWDFVEGARLWSMWWRQSSNEVRRRYKRTLLGPAWVTVSLLIFAIVLSFVWAGLFKMQVTEFLPFLLSGLLAWTLVSSCIGEACMVFVAGEALMKARQFPYTSLLYGAVARNAVIFGHNLIGYFLAAAFCGVPFGWKTLLVVPGLILVLMNCIWMEMVVAVFCLRFRDFQQLVASLLQIGAFVTPVFWNANQLTGKRAIIVHANPIHHMVDIVRQPLLGQAPALESYAMCAVTALVGWAFAYWLFASKRHRLAYWF